MVVIQNSYIQNRRQLFQILLVFRFAIRILNFQLSNLVILLFNGQFEILEFKWDNPKYGSIENTLTETSCESFALSTFWDSNFDSKSLRRID